MFDVRTRRKRRAAIREIHNRLAAIRDAEERYMANVPEAFQGSESYDVVEQAMAAIDGILDVLDDVY
jgi:DNA polymerase I-like protein with 3'-5' exonuclease and polymerase domains